MSNLDSELDIVILDEREMEEIGKSIVEGVCIVPVFRCFAEEQKETKKFAAGNNSVSFSSVFDEVFSKPQGTCLLLEKSATCSPQKEKPPAPIKFPIDQNKIDADLKVRTYKRPIKDRTRREVLFQKTNTPSRHTSPRGNARHWSRGDTLEKAQTFSEEHQPYVPQEIEIYSHSLPSIGVGPSDGILRVSPDTVASLLEKKRSIILIDCRFEYEFDGGHISTAQNIMTQKGVVQLFAALKKKQEASAILIFYCEYSSVRAPKLATCLRNEDRRTSTYPNILVPNLYIMEGGYKEFYKKHRNFCMPCSYIPM